MAGVLTLARFKLLNAASGLSDSQIHQNLRVSQSIAESLTGMLFGSEVTAVASSGDDRTLTVYGGRYEVGDKVRLLGGGVAATPFDVTSVGESSGAFTLTVSSASAISPTRVLPIVSHVGAAVGGELTCHPRPIYSVVSVETKADASALWKDTASVVAVASTDYELVTELGIRTGVRLKGAAIPMVREGGGHLVKTITRQVDCGIRATYAAGFYLQVPADIENAVAEMVPAIAAASVSGGVFASESMDYYSYSQLSADQLSVLPYASIAILRRYGRGY